MIENLEPRRLLAATGVGIETQTIVIGTDSLLGPSAVGPTVTAVSDGARVFPDGDKLNSSIPSLVVDFSDEMNSVVGGSNSVTNVSNWRLLRYGVDVSNQIASIGYTFNAITNLSEAVVTFSMPLTEGVYQLVALQTMQDQIGRPLDGDANGIVGGDFRRNFAVSLTLPGGSETRVNTRTANFQASPSVAMDAVGDYVVAWQSLGQDGSGYDIFAQRYNVAGTALGGEFHVNTYTTSNQTFPKVAMDAAGDFVVTWVSFGQIGSSDSNVYAQRYNAAGITQGSEFQVNTSTAGNQLAASIAMDTTGDFVVSWASFGQDGSGYGIYAQRYNTTGMALGGEFQVNSVTASNQTTPSVSIDAVGDFVVAWTSSGQDGNGTGIFAQRFLATGAAQGSEFRVNTFAISNQISPKVAEDGIGDFVVTWSSYGQDGGSYGIYAQRYNAAGIAQGSEFLVNSTKSNNQTNSSVSMDTIGEFVVTWGSQGQDGSGYGIYAQRYNSAGVAQRSELRVNTYTTGDQNFPSIAIDVAGDFVVAWSSDGQDGSGTGIYAQRYQADVAPLLYQIEPTRLTAVGPVLTPVTSTLLVYDRDSNYWSGATIQITANYLSNQDLLEFKDSANITASWNPATGTLTLTGIDTVSNYRTALHNVTYHNTSPAPNKVLVRTVTYQTSDSALLSNLISRDLIVTAANMSPVLSPLNGIVTYIENAPPLPLAAMIDVNDADSANLTSATVSFENWQGGDRLDFNNIFALQHTFTEDLVAHTAVMTITGNDTVDHYQTLLRSVVFYDVSDAPKLSIRIASFTVNDGFSNSNTVTRSIAVVAVNDAPLLSAIEASLLAYKANDPAFPPLAISATLLVSDPDSDNLTQATVKIAGGYQNDANGHDVLSFTNQLGITSSFNAATGTLTLTGISAVGNYRTALRSVKFSTSGSATSTATRTLTLTATDDFSPTHATSLAIARAVSVSITNIAPLLAGIPNSALAYARGTSAVAVAPSVVVNDPDSINMVGATIQIVTNYQNGEDVLAFTAGFGVTGSFATTTGTLTLTGMTTLANYQTLLRSVTYKTNTAAASTLNRAISFKINDGLVFSSPKTRNVAVT